MFAIAKIKVFAIVNMSSALRQDVMQDECDILPQDATCHSNWQVAPVLDLAFGSSMSTAPELPSLFRADSLAEQAYRVIREGIATGLFSAGERVTERGLAARLNVSATPVREALRRLEQEGLIERVSARQLRIVDHSSDTLRELLLTGAALRAMEARFANRKLTDAALDRMAAIVDVQASAQGIDIPERLRIAREFDMEIERAADNP